MEGESTGLEKRLLLALFVAVIVIISGFAYLFLGGSEARRKKHILKVLTEA